MTNQKSKCPNFEKYIIFLPLIDQTIVDRKQIDEAFSLIRYYYWNHEIASYVLPNTRENFFAMKLRFRFFIFLHGLKVN